jgi:hypothetical protein
MSLRRFDISQLSGPPTSIVEAELVYVGSNNALEWVSTGAYAVSLSSNVTSVNEGQSINITLEHGNRAPDGESFAYTITGVSSADINSAPLIGAFYTGNAESIVLNTSEDLTTEGTETLTITLDSYPRVNTSITILDSSQDPVGSNYFTTAGSHTFVVPEGVESISAVVVGGGGGGGGAARSPYSGFPRAPANSPFTPEINLMYSPSHYQGKGGNGGDLAWANSIPVTPGESLTVVVGAAGNGGSVVYGSAGNAGGNGGASYIARGGTTLVSAGGGVGGLSTLVPRYSTGSAGSNPANSTPFVFDPTITGTTGEYRGGVGGRSWSDDGNAESGSFNINPSISSGGGGGAAGYEGVGGGGGSLGSYYPFVDTGNGSGSPAPAGGGGGGQASRSYFFNTTSPFFPAYVLTGGAGGGVGLTGKGPSGAGGAPPYTLSHGSSVGGDGSPPGPFHGGGGGGAGSGMLYIGRPSFGTYPGGYAKNLATSGGNGQVGGVGIKWGNTYP